VPRIAQGRQRLLGGFFASAGGAGGLGGDLRLRSFWRESIVESSERLEPGRWRLSSPEVAKFLQGKRDSRLSDHPDLAAENVGMRW
jgi:hypothetical protein